MEDPWPNKQLEKMGMDESQRMELLVAQSIASGKQLARRWGKKQNAWDIPPLSWKIIYVMIHHVYGMNTWHNTWRNTYTYWQKKHNMSLTQKLLEQMKFLILSISLNNVPRSREWKSTERRPNGRSNVSSHGPAGASWWMWGTPSRTLPVSSWAS